MAYSNNPHLPKVRMQAVMLVRKGWSIRKVARYTGFHHTAVLRWLRKAPSDGRRVIPTESSRPKNHPQALSYIKVDAIVAERKKRNRCAEVIHQELMNQGIVISLSSVKRTLKREGLIRERSPWKRWHQGISRPEAINPGDLVQIDTIHLMMPDGTKVYVYTLIDIVSRWAHAKVSRKINTHRSVWFVREAQQLAPFTFKMIQSDHGSEFSTYFSEQIGIPHRHSRVRQSNDNAHIERFNRTIQEECLDRLPRSYYAYQKAIKQYLLYYNGRRLHLGINLKFPLQVVRSY